MMVTGENVTYYPTLLRVAPTSSRATVLVRDRRRGQTFVNRGV
jgi:hypothetical protein